MLKWPPKEPGEVVSGSIDWSVRLAQGDVITSSSWTLPPGSSLTTSLSTNTPTLTQITVAGGIVGQTYTLVNTVQTAFGSTLIERVSVLVKLR